MILEACVENLSEALLAQKLGANRIELCENLAVGGTTPSIGSVILCKRILSIPVTVMIRPRGGNFVYNEAEIAIMLEDIRACLRAGADGIATGVLTLSGEVDIHVLKQLQQEAGTMQVTFHKAIDEAKDIEKEVLMLAGSGIHRILTSGGEPTATEGVVMLRRLISLAGKQVTIMPAGKITLTNLPEIQKLIPAREFHGRKIVGDLTSFF